ncbi:MAG: hypothetical protein U0L67_01620 [Paludibacteraceae bacterium]|mgnify:FL=1|jgi:hypothetical protein|nr:hypothetical protein [Paludibacteraceae bacterium]MEE0911125.1 hypothetical protein [Paludibacteraceae bacterium]
MKRIFLAISALAISFATFAQSAYDALNLSQTNPVLGTARYSAMAGALGALGGNVSTMKDNPAGLGIYRSFDITFTPSFSINNDGEMDFNLNNFGLVVNFGNRNKSTKGYVTSSLGVSFNRLRNYSHYSSLAESYIHGKNEFPSMTDNMGSILTPDLIYDEAIDLGLIGEDGNSLFGYDENGNSLEFDKSWKFSESGRIYEWDFSYGMNISNRFYWGVSIGARSVRYSQKSMYDEACVDGSSWYLDNYYQATGIGANFKVGAIARATDWLRIGFAFHTPTFYDMEDESNIEFDYNGQFADEPSIANDYYEYALQTPLKLQASLGFVIAKRALIGVEYNFENFKSMRLEMNDMVVEDEGRVIKDEMNKNSSLKIGAEVKVIDEFSLRAGFAYVGKPMQTITSDLSENIGLYIPVSVPKTSMYITGGAGYSGEHFYCDIAYIYNNQKRDLYVSMPTDKPTLDLKYANHDIMATFGWKF